MKTNKNTHDCFRYRGYTSFPKTFIKFMSEQHLSGRNIAMYRLPFGRFALVGVNVSKFVDFGVLGFAEEFGNRVFPTADDAQEWYDRHPGCGLGRLSSAIRNIQDAKP